MDIGFVAAEFEAGTLAPERLADVATQMLEAGWDSPSLRLAAGGDQDDSGDQRARFRRALEELEQVPLAPHEIAERLTTLWASRLVRGEVDPLAAARELWTLSVHHVVPFSDDSFWEYGALDPDEYAAPEIRDAYERDIRAAATRWLAGH